MNRPQQQGQMRPGSMPGRYQLSSGRELLRPVIAPGSRGRVLSSESCSGCSGLDNGRGTGGCSDLTVPGAAGITGGRSGLTVAGSS